MILDYRYPIEVLGSNDQGAHMRNILRLLSFILLMSGATNSMAEERRYRIAVIIPLSGQVAPLGAFIKRGIDLALEELPPSQREKIDVVYEDDQFSAPKTISAYRKLKAMGGVDAVFVGGSSTANALGPITENDKTILMAVGASDPTIAVGKTYSFIHWVIPDVLGEALAAELINRGLKKIAFISADVSGTIADINAAINALKNKGRGDVVMYRQNFFKEETDYRSALLQIKNKNADAVVLALFPGALSSFVKQFRAMKLPAELIGMETFEDDGEVKASGGGLVGGWYVNAAAYTEEFIAAYRKKYGEYQGWATGNAYDALRLVAEGAVRFGSNNDAIRDHLRGVKDYHGACGVYSASGDNRFLLPAALKRVTDKGFEPFEATKN